MLKPLQKVVLILISSFYLLVSSASFFPAHAEGPTWYNQDFQSWYEKVSDDSNPGEIFGERYTSAQVEWVVYGLFAFILNHVSNKDIAASCIGGDAVACTEAIATVIQKLIDLSEQADQSGLQEDQSLLALVFAKRPFSGIGMVRDKIASFRIIPEAKAETTGFGFGALKPITDLWVASRNFAYVLSAIVVIIFAFMIMFRVKIAPQTVISVQSALPKMFAALILVTFSFAIAGLMIDLMYIIIGIISAAISPVYSSPEKVYQLMTDGLFGFGGFLMNLTIYSIIFYINLLFLLFTSGNPLTNFLLTISGMYLMIFILLVVISAIILFILFFRIFWLLLKTTALTYLIVAIGPIQIMLGSLRGGGMAQWLRVLASNLAVFPVVGALFVLAFYFVNVATALGLGKLIGDIVPFENLWATVFGWENPFIVAEWSPPLTLGIDYIPLIFLGISFVIITMIPKAADIIKSAIEGKPFSYGSAISEAVNTPVTLARGGLAARVGKWEEGRKEAASRSTAGIASYEPAPVTKFLSTTGVIKTN